MYGPSIIMPNMHLHAHLKQCIADYGPFMNFGPSRLRDTMDYLGSCPTISL